MTAAILDIVLYLLVPLVLLTIGWLAGRAADRSHLARLTQREQALAGMPVADVRTFAPAAEATRGAALVVAEVVIATDYLKTFLARLRNIFGGEVKSYGLLLLRARREAITRLLEQARGLGFNAVCNVRLETADIGGNTASRRGANMAAILASGTAYVAVQGDGP